MATWGSSFKQSPPDAQSPSLGDDRMRETREAIENRMDNEHLTYLNTGTNGSEAQDWAHRQGSAVAFFQDAAPTTQVGGRTLAARDSGRLWFDDNNDDLLHFWDGTQWLGLISSIIRASIQGIISTGGGVIPNIVFPHSAIIVGVYINVQVAPTGASLQVDLEKNGNSGQSIFDTNDYVEIAADATSGNSTDMESTYSVLTAGDYLSVDIDQVGSTIAGSDLSISIDYRRS